MPDDRYTLFYDGHCALCHRAVQFVLAHDGSDGVACFAPLGGAGFRESIPEDRRGSLPDSLVVLTSDGRLLSRSDAVLHILTRLGGGWRALAHIVGLAPRALRDAAYDGIARVRYRVFGTRDEACPVIPSPLRAKFDLRA
jgi:predicted DCC family thiol-disulfide oxidoreductase YuxK